MLYGLYAEKYDIANKLAKALSNENVKIDKTNGYCRINCEGDTIIITWGSGHMCELYQAKDYDDTYKNWSALPVPFIPSVYKIKVRNGNDLSTGKKLDSADSYALKQLKIVKEQLSKVDKIIIATDDDREGELIFAYVRQYTGLSNPCLRMKLSSLTEEGIKDAYHHLVDAATCKGVEDAGRCRAIADWLVGANLTAQMTNKYQRYVNIPMITLGRVQTTVLNFIVEREKAINSFEQETFYKIEGDFVGESNKEYHGIVSTRYEKKEEADEIVRNITGKNGEITSVKKEKLTKPTPMLYNLADLQRAANEGYGYTADETLKIVQSLYEKGYVSYPRTTSKCLTDDMRDAVVETLKKLAYCNDDYLAWIGCKKKFEMDDKYFNTSEVESHYAIIPTLSVPKSLSGDEAKIYDIIAKSMIRMIYGPALFEKTIYETTVDDVVFKTTGMVTVDPGWQTVATSTKKKDIQIPKLDKGTIVSGKYEVRAGKTEPPKRYTDATLLTAMQTASKEVDDAKLKAMLVEKNKGGIGRPSTQANIIKTVKDKYCQKNTGKNIVPTSDAMKVIDLLPIEDLKSPTMTAEWESKLDEVEKGTRSLGQFIREIESKTGQWARVILNSSTNMKPNIVGGNESEFVCPKCKNKLTKFAWGYKCNECEFSIGYNLAGASLTDEDIKTLLEKKRSTKQYKFVKKDGNDFKAYLTIEDGEVKFSYDTGLKCPKCGKMVKFSREGDAYCEDWTNCDFKIYHMLASKCLNETIMRQLIEKGKTDTIKGFKDKNGQAFSSKLVLKDGKVEFKK